MDSIFWIVIGLLATPFALLGLLFLALAVYVFFERWALILFGERAVARIVGHSRKKNDPENPAEEGLVAIAITTPFLRLEFVDSNGETCRVSSDTSASPRKYPVGDEVPILYRPARPKTFVIDRFGMKWSAPVWMLVIGVALLSPGMAGLCMVWPTLGAWMSGLGRQAAPAVPYLFMGLSFLFVLLGAGLLRNRWHRSRYDFRTLGKVASAGRSRKGGESYQWIRVEYLDGEARPHTRTLAVASARREGDEVSLLVDPDHPQDVLVDEPFELWFVPLMCLGVGTASFIAFSWSSLAAY